MIWGSNPDRGKKFFSLQNVQTGSRCQGSFVKVKQPGLEVNHSSPSGIDANNEWSYTSSPPVCLHGMDKDNVTFYFCFNTIW